MTQDGSHPKEAMTPTSTDLELGLLDAIEIVKDNFKLLVITPLIVGVSVFAITFVVSPTFTAKTVFLPPQQQQSAAAMAMQSLGSLAGLAGVGGAIKNPGDQYVSLMLSTTIANRIVERFKLFAVYEAKTREEARNILRANVRIDANKKDGLITVEVDDKDPQRAANLANEFVNQLRRMTNDLAITESQQRRFFFEKQIKQTSERLALAQRNLQQSGIGEGALRAEPKAAADTYAALRAQTTAAEIRLQALRSYLTEDAMEFKAAQSNLTALRTQMNKVESSSNAEDLSDYIGKYREFKYQETLFELFARQYELAKLDESREGSLIQVVDIATPPERNSKPKRALLSATAMLLTGILLVLYVFARAGWRNLKARGALEN